MSSALMRSRLKFDGGKFLFLPQYPVLFVGAKISEYEEGE